MDVETFATKPASIFTNPGLKAGTEDEGFFDNASSNYCVITDSLEKQKLIYNLKKM